MININNYILEKLHINKKSKLEDLYSILYDVTNGNKYWDADDKKAIQDVINRTANVDDLNLYAIKPLDKLNEHGWYNKELLEDKVSYDKAFVRRFSKGYESYNMNPRNIKTYDVTYENRIGDIEKSIIEFKYKGTTIGFNFIYYHKSEPYQIYCLRDA